jgi:hypothetical protein
MALARDFFDTRAADPTIHDGTLATGAVAYAGGYAMQCGISHVTAADRGYVRPWNDQAGAIPFGRINRGGTGLLTAARPPTASMDLTPHILKNIAVTGVTAITDVGRTVYMTDDYTFTITAVLSPAAPNIPVGRIIAWRAATRCDVLMWGVVATDILAMAGAGFAQMVIPVTGICGAGANVLTGLVMPFHGKFTYMDATIAAVLAGAGADISYNLEIDGTNVTGGVVQCLLADTTASHKTGSAIIAANEFHQGSVVDIEVAVAAASTAGLVNLIIGIERLVGL